MKKSIAIAALLLLITATAIAHAKPKCHSVVFEDGTKMKACWGDRGY